jgi:putative ABC transport system permease protein
VPGPEDPPPAWVSEAMVDLYGFRTGRLVALPIAGRPVTFLVAGVWRDYARQYGAVVMQLNDYRRLTHDNRVSDAALWLAPDATPTQVAQRLRHRLAGGEQVQYLQPNEIHAVSMGIFDRSFAITYLLEAVAVLVGVCGIAASFSAQALARTREFGVLRHLGVTQAQISAMLALEGGLLALLGVCAGLLLGWAIALILIRVVNPQSFHWSMDLMMPWRSLALLAIALIAAAALTALFSGRRAMSGSAVRAVKEDW